MNQLRILENAGQVIFDSAPDPMVIINDEGTIVTCNKRVYEVFGYQTNDIVGSSIEIFVPQRFRDRHNSLISSFFKNPSSRDMGSGMVLTGLKSDGSEFPVEISLSPINTEHKIFVCASIRDVTNRIRSANKFQQLLDSAPDALILVNKEGNITLSNQQATRLFGYSEKEFLTLNISSLMPERHRTDHFFFVTNFFKDPKTRQMGAFDELFAIDSKGKEFPVEISLSPVQTEDGPLVCAAIRDISNRKYIKELETKNDQLEQFNFVVSHDLQEPLNTILGFLNLIDLSPEINKEEILNYHVHIRNSAERMKDLIGGLLEFSRIGATSFSEPINLNELLKDILSDLNNSIEENQANIQLSNLPDIIGFKVEIRSLFQNLIANALKFHKHDQPPHIRISCQKLTSEWKFAVSDNGIGIHETDKNRIFDIFKRVNKSAFRGSGIGLAQVKKIVELHKGKVWVESQPGFGSTFYFTIPFLPDFN